MALYKFRIIIVVFSRKRIQWRRNEFESGGHTSTTQRRIFLSCPPLFCSASTISRFGERFRDGQYCLASLLFAVLLITVPPSRPANCKSGGNVPPCPMESAPVSASGL